jgi:hypothetical protein
MPDLRMQNLRLIGLVTRNGAGFKKTAYSRNNFEILIKLGKRVRLTAEKQPTLADNRRMRHQIVESDPLGFSGPTAE